MNNQSFTTILNTVDGRYLPSFFIIQMDTALDPRQFTTNNLTHTIVHEFVQFFFILPHLYNSTNFKKKH